MSNIVKKKIKNVLSNEDRKSLKLILKFCKNNNYLSPFQRRVLYLNGKLDNITEDSIIFLYKTLNDFYPEHIFEKYLESEEIKLENGLIIPKTLANLSIDILDKIEIKYLQISSDKNDKVAQYKLARKLSSTMDPKVIGISNDLDKAFELFKKSSDQLYPEAELMMGGIYSGSLETNIRVDKDYNKAIDYFKGVISHTSDEGLLEEAEESINKILNEIIDYLLDKGRKQNYLNWDEIDELIPADSLSEDQIENFYEQIEKFGIEIYDTQHSSFSSTEIKKKKPKKENNLERKIIPFDEYFNKKKESENLYPTPKITQENINLLIIKNENQIFEKKSTAFVNLNEIKDENSSLIPIFSVMKTIAAFLNMPEGGQLIIGVDEKNNNSIVGIEKDFVYLNSKRQNIDGFELKLTENIKTWLGSSNLLNHIRFEYIETNNCTICVVNVEWAYSYGPVFLTTPSKWKGPKQVNYYRRSGNKSEKLDGREMYEHWMQNYLYDYEEEL